MDQLTLTEHERNLQLWLSRIRECRASGITVTEWCRQQGFNTKTYYYWMRKIKRETFEALPAEIKAQVPIRPLPHNTTFAEIPIIPTTENKAIACRICLGNTVVEIYNGADSITIEKILRMLKNLC